MCFHDKPTRNDELVDWQWRAAEAPPAIQDGDEILFDECGRCKPQVNGTGKIDYHSHHFRIVKSRLAGPYCLLVRHGGGDERFELGYGHTRIAELIGLLPDSDARYLMIHALYSAHKDAAREAAKAERERWMRAAIDKRIKTKRVRGGNGAVNVWIEEPKA